jgi:hypothetical protein
VGGEGRFGLGLVGKSIPNDKCMDESDNCVGRSIDATEGITEPN